MGMPLSNCGWQCSAALTRQACWFSVWVVFIYLHDIVALMQVAVCCFDKTGTLTSDDMVLRGLAGLPEKGRELLQDVKAAGKDTLRVLAACQSLIHIEGDLVGDPLERAAFEATGEAATAYITMPRCGGAGFVRTLGVVGQSSPHSTGIHEQLPSVFMSVHALLCWTRHGCDHHTCSH